MMELAEQIADSKYAPQRSQMSPQPVLVLP
jgi:hypothetical protein